MNISSIQPFNRLNTTAAVSFGVLGNESALHVSVDVDVLFQVSRSSCSSSVSQSTLSGDSGQPDAESSVSAVSGHPGEHGAAG